MKITDILSPNVIKVPLDALEKKEAIYELVDLLTESGVISNSQILKQVVWEREQQRSTGIGEGLAIPHGKTNCTKHIAIAIGIPSEPIEYDAVDGKPVKLIVLLASPPDKTADHIQALGKISRLMGNDSFRRSAYEVESAQQLYELFCQAETPSTA
ncbi:MAG: PTS sugar transporter subunit IIA [Planctomycetes bacterium]|nr:PTS sugar transporter subunit IIA [Planctomycetota bacterium]